MNPYRDLAVHHMGSVVHKPVEVLTPMGRLIGRSSGTPYDRTYRNECLLTRLGNSKSERL